ncbi:hypothetical protein Dda_6695 [Drechslerella dactyloides]|uniref:Vezatin n=1 Tax=Drechslerella dactyloides TaxID=74499 RepID=A0AAD6IUL8_DREDA|nr:hypothetical protein Dda_6695 [Drechslerella dactyloides]
MSPPELAYISHEATHVSSGDVASCSWTSSTPTSTHLSLTSPPRNLSHHGGITTTTTTTTTASDQSSSLKRIDIFGALVRVQKVSKHIPQGVYDQVSKFSIEKTFLNETPAEMQDGLGPRGAGQMDFLMLERSFLNGLHLHATGDMRANVGGGVFNPGNWFRDKQLVRQGANAPDARSSVPTEPGKSCREVPFNHLNREKTVWRTQMPSAPKSILYHPTPLRTPKPRLLISSRLTPVQKMEPLVFRDSPLAEYLEGDSSTFPSFLLDQPLTQRTPGEGESLAGLDWSMEPSDNNESSSTRSSSPHMPNFAPPSTIAPKARKKSLRPLHIQNPQWYRRANLNNVLSGGLKSRLASGENLQFIERFRYVLVASQLLNEQASVANYDLRDPATLPTPQPASINPFPALITWFGSPSPRFYAYTAASIIILSILVSYLSRGGPERKSAFGRSRIAITLLLSMVLALLVFAHLRRVKLRNLRTDAIAAAEQFVDSCQTFDVVAGNAITLIQEIELVSRGYRLSQPLPPITRLERADSSRKCARLRRTIAECFRLSIPPMGRAIEALAQFPRSGDLEKFYDVYDIHAAELRDAIMSDADDIEAADDPESLRALKAMFQRLYSARKIFVCHLLALEAAGGRKDHLQWHAVEGQLRSLGRLSADLAAEIRTILTEETDFKIPPTPVTSSPMASSHMSVANRERLRHQLRRFNSLSASVRGLQAKMHLLREGTDKALQSTQEPAVLDGFAPELLMQYDEIGEDLRGLVAEWESGRAALSTALIERSNSPAGSRPSSLILAQGLASPGMSTAGTLIGSSPRNSGTWDDVDGAGKRASTGSDFLRPPPGNGSGAPASDEEEVFEAISEPNAGRPRSKLTREERIVKMREDRHRALEARQKAEASVSLVRELRDVLENRATQPSLKRRSLPAPTKSRLSLELIKAADAGQMSAPATPMTPAPEMTLAEAEAEASGTEIR